MIRTFVLSAILGAALPLAAPAAADYPERPLRFVVNFPPGGAADTIARLFGQEIGAALGQPVVVENKAGAGGAIGMVYAAKQPADGYTFTMGTLGSAIVQPLIQKTPYDMLNDFDPVSLIATGPAVLVVNGESPYKSVADIVNTAKTNPDVLNYGSGGIGTFAHLTGAMLNQAAGIDITHVPYKGGVQALQDVLANQLEMIAVDPPSALPHIRSGKLRAVAYTGAQRSPLLPDVPTFAESGYPSLVGANSWSIWMPAGVPRDIAATFHQALNKTMENPALREKFAELGAEATHSTPEELRRFVLAEKERYAKVVQQQGFRPQ
ncbi:tripartite tricarboxylate transporter substrate binding protein [Verticiella sediminum]|uniref:Tripartite tricarboxylate transporter substrate binding protein n=1 Tax=Verticiella sediminum TaxID=1247510 RepID=A0A556ABB6_9BURK|nr:tripartite tricarboxylate transporter substrate binding protein [Verticiella sediminum]TSH90182.1 tripartite tricarboxylate transporter substrate binding protein [Verticiella sediminum]